jgi:hypothetical protein
LKSVKGVLNKLTPEKFDRLLGQLVAAVTSVDVLNGLIRLVFDNAVCVVVQNWSLVDVLQSSAPCSLVSDCAHVQDILSCNGMCSLHPSDLTQLSAAFS